PTDEDWKDVRMALVSGRPISFQMDLYTPLYVSRPVVVPELFQSLRPVAYSGSMEEDKRQMAALRARSWTETESLQKKSKADPSADSSYRLAPAKEGGKGYADGIRGEMKERMDLGRSVASAASAAKLGDFFQYAIDKPVTLPRQKSALLPIVG